MISISMKREALLAELAKQLRVAGEYDREQVKKHKAETAAMLKAFREKLRLALKWDYATAKKSGSLSIGYPNCPSLKSTWISSAMRMVNFDTRKSSFRITEGSDLHRALTWVPDSQRPKASVCEL